jgi:hypothetical protein
MIVAVGLAEAFAGALLFGGLFIWVGIVRLRDTLKGRGKGSWLGGVLIGAGSIAFGVFVIAWCLKLATSPPDEPATSPHGIPVDRRSLP